MLMSSFKCSPDKTIYALLIQKRHKKYDKGLMKDMRSTFEGLAKYPLKDLRRTSEVPYEGLPKSFVSEYPI